MPAVRRCALAALLLPWFVAAAPIRETDLERTAVTGGSYLATAEDGRLAILTRQGMLLLFAADGSRIAEAAVPAPVPGASPTGLALRGALALIPFSVPETRGLTCVLLDATTGRPVRHFVGPEAPAKVFGAVDAWVFERVSPAAPPSLIFLDDHGTDLGTVELPPLLVTRARDAFGDPNAAVLRFVPVSGRLWGVASGIYELWSVDRRGSWRRIEPPPSLRVVGHQLTGPSAERRLREFAEGLGVAERQRILSSLDEKLALGLPLSATFGAVRRVASRGPVLAALVDTDPARERGGCRLDLWRPEASAIPEVVQLPGRCPSFIAVADEGVWLLDDGRFTRLPLPTTGAARR